jgi:YD repeat-containing protein
LAALALAAGAAVGSAWAQTALPATPPVSPTQVVDLEYDAEGQPTKTIVDKITATNPRGLGLTSSQHYNPLNQLDQSTDPKNGVTKLEYDGQGRLTKVTDPLNLITEYLRNGLGDLFQQSSPDTSYSGFSKLDAAGNPVLRNDARSSTGVATYDAKNRLTRIDYTLIRMAETYTWTYDQTGPTYGAGIGHLTSTSTSIGVGTRAVHFSPQ